MGGQVWGTLTYIEPITRDFGTLMAIYMHYFLVNIDLRKEKAMYEAEGNADKKVILCICTNMHKYDE